MLTSGCSLLCLPKGGKPRCDSKVFCTLGSCSVYTVQVVWGATQGFWLCLWGRKTEKCYDWKILMYVRPAHSGDRLRAAVRTGQPLASPGASLLNTAFSPPPPSFMQSCSFHWNHWEPGFMCLNTSFSANVPKSLWVLQYHARSF